MCRSTFSSCGGLRPLAEAFFDLWQNKRAYNAYNALGPFLAVFGAQ